MNLIQRSFPWVIALALVAFLAAIIGRGATPAEAPSGMPIEGISQIPVSASGRTKPLDTFARNELLKISGRQSYEADGQLRPAIEWLLEVWKIGRAHV